MQGGGGSRPARDMFVAVTLVKSLYRRKEEDGKKKEFLEEYLLEKWKEESWRNGIL